MEGFEPTFSTPITPTEFVARNGYICILLRHSSRHNVVILFCSDCGVRTHLTIHMRDGCFPLTIAILVDCRIFPIFFGIGTFMGSVNWFIFITPWRNKRGNQIIKFRGFGLDTPQYYMRDPVDCLNFGTDDGNRTHVWCYLNNRYEYRRYKLPSVHLHFYKRPKLCFLLSFGTL